MNPAQQAQIETGPETLLETIRNSRPAQYVAAGLATAAMLGTYEAAAGTTEAEAGTKTYQDGKSTITETSESTVAIGSSEMSAESAAKKKIVGNLRTVSKARIRQAARKGQCDTISGRRAVQLGIQTYGYKGKKGFEYENRRSTLCDLDGDGDYDVRADCGNKARQVRPNKRAAKQVLWVNNFKKAKLNLHSKVSVSATSECFVRAGSGYAKANSYGYGESEASARMKISSAMKFRGRGLMNLRSSQVSTMSAELRTKARANANTNCEIKGGKIVKPGTPPPKPPVHTKGSTSVDVTGPQHVFKYGEIDICARSNDPENDEVKASQSFSETGSGNFTSNVYRTSDPKQFCIKYKAGEPGPASVTATQSDARGNRASDTEAFPIVDESGEGEFRNRTNLIEEGV